MSPCGISDRVTISLLRIRLWVRIQHSFLMVGVRESIMK